jgi:hypothetical protein
VTPVAKAKFSKHKARKIQTLLLIVTDIDPVRMAANRRRRYFQLLFYARQHRSRETPMLNEHNGLMYQNFCFTLFATPFGISQFAWLDGLSYR